MARSDQPRNKPHAEIEALLRTVIENQQAKLHLSRMDNSSARSECGSKCR